MYWWPTDDHSGCIIIGLPLTDWPIFPLWLILTVVFLLVKRIEEIDTVPVKKWQWYWLFYYRILDIDIDYWWLLIYCVIMTDIIRLLFWWLVLCVDHVIGYSAYSYSSFLLFDVIRHWLTIAFSILYSYSMIRWRYWALCLMVTVFGSH